MASPREHAVGGVSGRFLPDTELWRRAVDGEGAAFGILFDRHANAVYSFCVRRVGDPAAAEDLVSTTFLRAWRRRGDVRFAGESALPWLYGVAANLVRRHQRGAGRRRIALLRLGGQAAEPDPADAVAGRLDEERRLRAVIRAIQSLAEQDRELLALCAWQGLSYEEAAIALDVPVGTIRSRLSRARARLRKLLEEPGPGIGDETRRDHLRTRKEGGA